MTTQATQTNWVQDADWLEEQVKAMQFMLGTTLSNELIYQLRNAVMELDFANGMVISYAVTVRNLAAYTIEDVQANRRVLQTVTAAGNDLAKQVDKRQACVDKLLLLLTVAVPTPSASDAYICQDIRDRRTELANTICDNAARRTVQQ
jgi:hypothetical protein